MQIFVFIEGEAIKKRMKHASEEGYVILCFDNIWILCLNHHGLAHSSWQI
jgi:hypothetical protein